MADLAYSELERPFIHMRHEVIRLGIGEPAARAVRMAEMAQMAPVVLKVAAALGAGGEVTDDALGTLEVVG